MTNRRLGGYIWYQEIAKGRLAVKRVRVAIETMGLTIVNSREIARLTMALLEIEETYVELARIGRNEINPSERTDNP